MINGQVDNIDGRFKDAMWANAGQEIIVGGAGGIGSWLTFFLTRLGANSIAVYDFDVIEAHNIGGQLFPVSDISKSKLESLNETTEKYSDFSIITVPSRYEGQNATNIMFAAFDNMLARKQMAEAWYSYQLEKRKLGTGSKSDVNIYIDGRMEAEQAIIYVVDSISDYKRYQAELFDDDAVELGPCSLRATTHNAALIAGNMVSILTNALANKKLGGKFRKVPFKLTYEIPTLTYNTEV